MSDTLVETEIKLRVENADSARKNLISIGFSISRERIFEANSVYDLPGGELRLRGQLLRLRLAGDQSVLTWKGPEQAGRHKSRPETEVGVADFDKCDRLLQDLGYKLVFRYDKYRTEFRDHSGDGTATLDETPVGVFLELEGPPEWIDETAARLGYRPEEYITLSYGALYKEYCLKEGIEPGFMQF